MRVFGQNFPKKHFLACFFFQILPAVLWESLENQFVRPKKTVYKIFENSATALKKILDPLLPKAIK